MHRNIILNKTHLNVKSTYGWRAKHCKNFCKIAVNIPTYHPSQTSVTNHNCIPTVTFLDRIAKKKKITGHDQVLLRYSSSF